MLTPRELTLPNGHVAVYHDNACHGEDAYVIRELSPYNALDVVLDGATGSGGKFASQHVAELLQSAPVAALDDVIGLLDATNRALYRRGRGSFFLTTVSLALKLGEALHVVTVGDSPMFLFRDGEMMSLTAATTGALPLGMNAMLGQQERLRYKTRQLTLRERDWLITASDGLTQNVAPSELVPVLQGITAPEEAVAALGALLDEKKRGNKGRVDDYTSFLPDDTTVVLRYIDPNVAPRPPA
jgi:serine/threonine protein phosphatase PrpC